MRVFMFRNLDRASVAEGLAQGTILLVDVREAHEYAAGHIPGAVSMPLSVFDVRALPQEEGKAIVLACAAGMRSQQALMLANEQGLPLDTHYGGGFRDWALSGMPVEA
jgi:rhodanese-related sulfurtransferase